MPEELEKTRLINRIEAALDSSKQGDALEADTLAKLRALAEGTEDPAIMDRIKIILDRLEGLTDTYEKIRRERERTVKSIEELEKVADMLDAKGELMDRIQRLRRRATDEIDRYLEGDKGAQP